MQTSWKTHKNGAFSATGLVQCTSCNIFRVPHPQHLVLIHVFVRKVSIFRSNSPRLAPPPTQNLPDPPLFLPPPSNIMMALLSLFLLSGANSTTNFYIPPPPNIAFSDPPVFLPPPLEIIIGPAQWIGVKLWSLGRGCCHYLPILPCALRGGFGIFRVQNSV